MLRFYLFFFLFKPLIIFSQNDGIYNPINTGVNMTIAILSVDSFVDSGDTIVALYRLDDVNYKQTTPLSNPNDFGIGGLTIWTGDRLAIAVWGNDNTSNKKDGFFHNEFINWAILKNEQYIPVQMIYKTGKNAWEPNGISIIDSLKTSR